MKSYPCRVIAFYLPLVFLILVLGSSGKGWAQLQSARPITIPLTFEPNVGQSGSTAAFVARTGHGQVLLTGDGMVLPGSSQRRQPVRLQLLHSQRSTAVGEQPTGGLVNYYATRDRHNWHTGIPMYSRVRYQEIYPGIDAVFHGNGERLEYDFEVQPGSSARRISFRFNGAEKIGITKTGSISVRQESNRWELLAPTAYQIIKGARRDVCVRYRIAGSSEIRLEVGSYDESAELIIDPVVQYAGIIGVGTSGAPQDIAVDSGGNLILAGTAGQGYPVINGQAGQGINITKLNAAGDTILFSTFIQPSAGASLAAMQMDAAGNLYLVGNAGGVNFPVTSTALGTSGGYVMKLAPDGTLVYSSILGGAFPVSLKVDGGGNAYVTGTADSTLQTVNAFEAVPRCAVCNSAFFAKVDGTGTAYVFSSYLYDASSGSEARPASIDVDAAGAVYLFGVGAVPSVKPWQGQGALFISKFSPDGQTLQFSTPFGGGSQSERAIKMKVGTDGTVVLVGTTQSNDYPYTINAAGHPLMDDGTIRTFASAINPALTGLTYSTYLFDGTASNIFLDSNNHLYVVGAGNGLAPQNAVVSDANSSPETGTVVELDAAGLLVKFSRFGGHLTPEAPSAVAVDSVGNIFLAGGLSPHDELPQPDPILVGHSFDTYSGTALSATFFAKISPVNAPQISVDNVRRPFLFLRNAGSADLHISSMTFSGGQTTGNCGAVVPAGSSCVVTVSDKAGGLAAGTLSITSDAQPSLQNFDVVLLKGDIPGTPIGDFLWFDDQPISPPRLQQTVPFHIWNVGTASAVINLITMSPGSSQTNDCGTGLAPGGNCTVQISLAGGGAFMTVFFDNGAQKSFNIFAPQVSQNPILSIAGIRFPTQFVGEVALLRTVTVTNTGASDIPVAPLLTGDPEFTIAGNTCPVPLPAHQSCVIGVQFTPNIDGNRTALLTVNGSTVQLSAQGAIDSAVRVSPLQQDFFPTVVHLQSTTLPITLTNTLATPVPITGITFSLADYTETDDCAGQVPASGACTVQVKFVPQAVGARNTTMTVSFTGATTQVLTLTGTGQTPFRVDPQVLNFTAAVGNSSPEQGVSIGNRLFQAEGYTFTVTGDFAIAQNSCLNPLAINGQPGSGCGPTIVFQPKTPGAKQGTFTVSYAGITEQDVVTLNGTVTAVTATPLQLTFPVTKISTTATLDVTLTNTGANPVGIVSVSTAAPFAESDACGGVVPGNGTCVLHVNFTPQTVTFPVTGTLNIGLADGAQYSVQLSGTGTGPVIAINASGTNFIDQVVGTTSSNPASISIINNGDAPLNISGISITGDFSQTNNCPASLVSTCLIAVTFSPKRTGLRTGFLTVTDDGFGSPQVIQFTGNGTDFAISATGAGASASVVAGQTATYNLAFTAVGSFSGQIQLNCSGAPPQGSCGLSSPNVTLIGNVPVPLTVTVSTSPHTSAAASTRQETLAGMNVFTGVLLLPILLISRRLRRSVVCRSVVIVAMLATVLMIASCGGGGGTQGASPPPQTQGGTPAGTYTITVTATDQTINGPVVHQTNLSLVVK